MLDSFFSSAPLVYGAAAGLRLVLLLYGLWQDAHSPLKYTDIDYFVFTDAAAAVARGASPYDRETYRYTPLLAWLLLPTTWGGDGGMARLFWFSSGKVLFALADLVAGRLLESVLLRSEHMTPAMARRLASIWLLNPMVATISTRGSSEGLLGVLVAALLWAVLRIPNPQQRQSTGSGPKGGGTRGGRSAGGGSGSSVTLAAILLGAGVHLKIYPFIYAPAIAWWLDDGRESAGARRPGRIVASLLTPARVRLAVISFATFAALNVVMFYIYGTPFIIHTYLHHLTRIDHRHNFSPYNILLYLNSADPQPSSPRLESLAFIPQLLLSTFLIPLLVAKKNLPVSMLAQTFAFVTFNKVCTSQYFLWYIVLLPLYLPYSSFAKSARLSVVAVVLWAGCQVLWLREGFRLEFLGESTFVPGLWLSSLAFYLTNCWILGIIVQDGMESGMKRQV